jgi:hypothetical protein
MQVVRTEGPDRFPPSEDALDAADHPLHSPRTEPPYPVAMVEWHDAWFDFDQVSPDDCRPDYVVRTVGFVVGEGPRFVSIAQEILPDGEGFRAVTHIPLPIVERIVRLQPRDDRLEA